jgi:hypothetical protein
MVLSVYLETKEGRHYDQCSHNPEYDNLLTFFWPFFHFDPINEKNRLLLQISCNEEK